MAVALVLCAMLMPATIEAQKPGKSLTKNEVIGLLESGVPPARIGELAQQYGLSFALTPQTETQLRDAGATEELLKTLRQLAPPPPVGSSVRSPAARSGGVPVLLIEATPGGAQVYVDDEPVGTTSSQGRLKLSQLAPGDHSVRISLAGHRDYEENLSLVSGQTVRVTASLEGAALVAPPSAQPSDAMLPAGAVSSAATAGLGVLLAENPPPGTQGVYVQDVVPGGPADKAGLRPGHAILSVGGRSVSSPRQVQETVAGFRPGTVIAITFSNGQAVQATGVQLVSRASLPSPSSQQVPTPSIDPLAALASAPQEIAQFSVAHDHGMGGSDYCVGTMLIGRGMVQYRSTSGVHSFELPLNALKEAKRNSVYLAPMGAFHIRAKKGTNYNFVVLNAAGQFQSPDALLTALDAAMGKN